MSYSKGLSGVAGMKLCIALRVMHVRNTEKLPPAFCSGNYPKAIDPRFIAC
jgi:hypothetical protein